MIINDTGVERMKGVDISLTSEKQMEVRYICLRAHASCISWLFGIYVLQIHNILSA